MAAVSKVVRKASESLILMNSYVEQVEKNPLEYAVFGGSDSELSESDEEVESES